MVTYGGAHHHAAAGEGPVLAIRPTDELINVGRCRAADSVRGGETPMRLQESSAAAWCGMANAW